MKPRITILMPVYNGEQYLKEAIGSILRQTYRDYTLLVINDGSTDRSREIVQSYEDSRIQIIDNDCNWGLVATLLNSKIKCFRAQVKGVRDIPFFMYRLAISFLGFVSAQPTQPSPREMSVAPR